MIAFELNGGHAASNRGWESSRWLFRDGINPPIAVDWDERTGTGADGQHGEGAPDPDAIGILACSGR